MHLVLQHVNPIARSSVVIYTHTPCLRGMIGSPLPGSHARGLSKQSLSLGHTACRSVLSKSWAPGIAVYGCYKSVDLDRTFPRTSWNILDFFCTWSTEALLIHKLFEYNPIPDTAPLSTMAIIYAAATAIVNPPGFKPFISQDQLWQALELKRT